MWEEFIRVEITIGIVFRDSGQETPAGPKAYIQPNMVVDLE